MGIRGLTTYIAQNARRFHESCKLHDCTLVVDGNSLACQLYVNLSDCNSAFGGDYDKYVQSIKKFFTLLKRCNIIPIVIVDGGYEKRKLKTVKRRLKDKYFKAKACTPANHNKTMVFPLFMMEVFKQTLRDLGIKFAQADFEGDFEIAAIARFLNCPVLSYDSDFYVFDVKYISFATLNLYTSSEEIDGYLVDYLQCEVYNVEHFIANFGGLDKSLLPLMSTLLGNDYVPASMFSKFYNRLKSPKSKKFSPRQRRIAATFEWLRKETLSSAITKILNNVGKGKREYIKKRIEQSVNGYIHFESELIDHLGLTEADKNLSFEDHLFQCPHELSEDSEGIEDEDEDDDDRGRDEEQDQDDGEEEEENEEEEEEEASSSESTACDVEVVESNEGDSSKSSQFPLWLKDKFRRGELPSFVSDIFYLRSYFCQIQVEDFTLNDSHVLSFPILKVICGLLFNCGQETTSNCDFQVICFIRSIASRFQKFQLEPTTRLANLPPFPPIANLADVPLPTRLSILYSTLGITSVKEVNILESFGEKWQLFAMAVIFWARSAVNPAVTNCHLHSIIICMIALGVVDKKIGVIRHQKKISKRKAGKSQKMQMEVSCRKSDDGNKCATPDAVKSEVSINPDRSLDQILLKVSETDCWNLAELFLQFHQVDRKLLGSPRQFCNQIVHLYAQLQTCLLQTMVLNSILQYPIPPCQIAEVYSGSVAYMAFTNFNRRNNVEGYIGILMRASPSVYEVYKSLRDKFVCLLPDLRVLFRKGRRKAKKRRSEPSREHCLEEEITPEEVSDCIVDANNRYSLLRIL